MTYARIDGIIAREAGLAVIFRRGPSKHTQQLIWDFATDRVTPGQWITGHVHTRRCDVSPDGRYLVGAFTNYRNTRYAGPDLRTHVSWDQQGWTAISRPPYFTALALWFMGGAWNGGGVWASNTVVDLNNMPYQWNEKKPVQSPVIAHKLNLPGSEDEMIFRIRLLRSGWCEFPQQLREFPVRTEQYAGTVYEKRFVGGLLRRIYWYLSDEWEAFDEAGKTVLRWETKWNSSHWLDVDMRGRVLYSDKGCLWAWADFPNGESTMIADLNANQFENVVPPKWALEW